MDIILGGPKQTTIEEVLADRTVQYRHGVHCCIWAPWDYCVSVGTDLHTRAAILMQLRFDGSFGFCGGLVNEPPQTHEDILEALHRELKEEINFNLEKFRVKPQDYMFSHKDEERKTCYHFYSFQVTYEQFKEIEQDGIGAEDYGDEVFGLVRIPLYTMKDGVRGFPMFLRNAFIGNAKVQLLMTLLRHKIFPEEELEAAVKASSTELDVK